MPIYQQEESISSSLDAATPSSPEPVGVREIVAPLPALPPEAE
jgi:hypothetical protein